MNLFGVHTEFDRELSRQLRDEGIQKAENNATEWINACRVLAYQFAVEHGRVASDDVLKELPRPTLVHPNATGSIFRDKRFKLVGYKTSSKVSAHARRIGIYQIA